MADYVQRYADKKIETLRERIAKTYAQAAREIKKKLEEFNNAHNAIAERMRRDVEAGKITKQDYQDWLRNQVYTGERWKAKLAEITKIYQNADKEARRMVGDTDKDVFQEAANRTAYEMGGVLEVRGGVSFDMYDRKTVDKLIKDNPKMLPEWKINEKKDYIWNEQRVQNAVTQGIIQGKSVYDIGEKLYKDLSASNANKMDMFARTAVTGAQNAGRVERMKEADEMGVKVKKRWLAAHDNRTRDTHAYLDGQEVDIDKPFVTFDNREIDYPGDPMADPDLVYNCRCTLVYVYPEYKPRQHLEEHQTYAEWKASH